MTILASFAWVSQISMIISLYFISPHTSGLRRNSLFQLQSKSVEIFLADQWADALNMGSALMYSVNPL